MSSAEDTDGELIPFTKVRRLIAERMVHSKAVSPHTLMVREVDYEVVERVRRQHAASFRQDEGVGLTYLAFNACATVEALQEFPHLNASVVDDALLVHKSVNLGLAVDLAQGGLVVGVVHHAERLGLREMARRIGDVSARARSGKLTMDDITGGTFTITNTGPFNTLITGAIINPPEVAILATDAISRRPVVVTSPDGTERIDIRSLGNATINFDHRAVDGAYAARFLARLATVLTERDWGRELVATRA